MSAPPYGAHQKKNVPKRGGSPVHVPPSILHTGHGVELVGGLGSGEGVSANWTKTRQDKNGR